MKTAVGCVRCGGGVFPGDECLSCRVRSGLDRFEEPTTHQIVNNVVMPFAKHQLDTIAETLAELLAVQKHQRDMIRRFVNDHYRRNGVAGYAGDTTYSDVEDIEHADGTHHPALTPKGEM